MARVERVTVEGLTNRACSGVEMTWPQTPVSPIAWVELLHGEVCWTLQSAGVRPLIVKGPTIAEWLYDGEPRVSSDADIMVAPSEWTTAVEALRDRGFVDY